MIGIVEQYIGYEFMEPSWFFLTLLLPLFFWLLYKLNRSNIFGVRYTNTAENQQEIASFFVLTLRMFLHALKILLFLLFIVLLAKPIKIDESSAMPDNSAYGIDLIFVLDVSLSMQAMDLKPNRLESAKRVIGNFVQQRKNDRIGLVVYSGEAYSACHKTTDHQLFQSQLQYVNGTDLVQGTAIGVGLGTGITQLRGDSTSSKAIILLTDGKNNIGAISPSEAAELAVNENIRVYTIGVGTNGYAPMPDVGLFGSGISYSLVEIDEGILKEISDKTGGRYFRATDSESLQNIIAEIDKIEKKIMNKDEQILPQTAQLETLLTLLLILTGAIILGDVFLFMVYE
ncbi:MAG: VWA domain-containing protein [Crocinitomicaceae bacterium]